MNWSDMLQQLINRRSLSLEQSVTLMQGWLDGAIAPELSGAILAALQCKGVDAIELAAMANVLQQISLAHTLGDPDNSTHSQSLSHLGNLLDTCGTGGDGADTFNISTSVAFVAAAAGVPVAKHGNRAMSSRSGSADVLEALGVNLGAAPEKIYEAIAVVGITFLFAPNWHPAMKAVGSIRRSLGVRTVFNLIGPLVNPMQPAVQVMGVYHKDLIEPVAEALRLLGRTQAVVLHSREGMDEAGLGDFTDMAFLQGDRIAIEAIDPQALGLAAAPLTALKGGSVAENAEILRSVLQGKGSAAQANCVALNSGVALRVAGKVTTWAEGVKLASEIISSGAAWQKLEQLVQFLQA
jgi:anthranilate phosphoribosyltransferase